MKKTIILSILLSALLLFTSCMEMSKDESDAMKDLFQGMYGEAYGEDFANEFGAAYDDAYAEYSKGMEDLKENKDEIMDGLKGGVNQIIDENIADKEQAEMVKEQGGKVIDFIGDLLSDEFDPIWPAETYMVNTLYHYKNANMTGSTRHSCHFSHLCGIDIGGSGDIFAIEDGTVILSEYSTSSGFGNWIKIEHENGMVSLYAHLASRNVQKGDEVKQGDVIGVMGNTSAKYSIGRHLHFELADENKGGDAWLTYYKDKYKKELVYEQNVVSNNEKYNAAHTVSSFIKSNYTKNGTYYYYKY